MSRAGYYGDGDGDALQYGQWRGQVASAIRGRRGQAFLRELREALDAMSEKRLAKAILVETAEVSAADGEPPVVRVNACALGVVALRRGIDTSRIDIEDYDNIHCPFGIANAMAREIIYENDESWPHPKSDEERWRKMRWWVEYYIRRDA